jgi:hydrogenase maturation protease
MSTAQPLRPPSETDLDLRFAGSAAVAEAVCWEGHVLYPYRASAAKNRFRWQWGVLVPPLMEAGSAERSRARVELVAEVLPGARIHVRARGLLVQARTVLGEVGREMQPVGSLDDGERIWVPFDEAVPWSCDLVAVPPDLAAPFSSSRPHVLEAAETTEPIGSGGARGAIVRTRCRVELRVEVDVAPVDPPPVRGADRHLVRIGVSLANETGWAVDSAPREVTLRHSTVGTHVLLAVDHGRFISSLDPPAHAVEAVAGCRCDGLFPVLVGGSEDLALASPIVLYDHPAVAPESRGDMFDATEIDEILALRVRTLTDEEKREARGTDARAAEVVARCDALDAAALGALHGTFRPLEELGGRAPAAPAPEPATPAFWVEDAAYDPWSDRVRVAGVELGAGSRVVLRPRRHADAQDLFVEGLTALVTGVFHDHEGEVHLAVALDDVAADPEAWHGRYLYFSADEVEPLPSSPAESSGDTQPLAHPGRPADASPRVLVAGVGNIFLGDDGFGVEVVNRIDPATVPAGVKVADFGIRGVHLAYELLEGYDVLVLVDAVSQRAAPGTLSLIEHDPAAASRGGTIAAMDAHGMDPAAVLAMAGDMGARVERILVLACEAGSLDEGIGLSEAVAGAVPVAVEQLTELLSALVTPSSDPRAARTTHTAPPSMEVTS